MPIQTLQTLAPSSAATPNTLELQRAYAKALMNPDHVAPPIQSWTQGVAGIVDALVGGTMARKAGDKEQAQLDAERAQQAAANGQFANLATALIGSGGNMPTANPSGGAVMPATGGAGDSPLVSQEQIRSFLASNAPDDLKAKVLELWKAKVTPQAHDYMAVDGNVWDKTTGGFAAQAPAKDTNDIAEYKYAKANGYEGSFQQYQIDLKRAGATNIANNVGPTGIDYGKPEEGYAWKRNSDGTVAINDRGAPVQVPIGGGSIEQKAAELATKTADAGKQTKVAGSVVLDDLDRAMAIAQQAPSATGFGGAISSAIPGTPAANLRSMLDSIKSNISFDRLQQMRQSSPTGGALGAVSDKEGQLLQSAYGSLEQSQSKEQFLQNLQRVRNIYMDIVHGPGGAAGGNLSRTGALPATQANVPKPVIIDGYTITPVD